MSECYNCHGAGAYTANNPYYGDPEYPREPMDTEEICPCCNGTGELDG